MLTRREAVAAGVAVAGWAAVPGWARKRPPGLARGVAFDQGVASGAPRSAGISLWTRVTGANGAARLGLQIATDEDFKRTLLFRRVLSDPDADQTVHTRIQDKRLKPGETYWYRFVSKDGGSPAGRFKLLPPRDSNQPLRIGVWTCQSWTEGFYTAHPHFAAEPDLDFVICLGDYIYEYGGAASGGRPDPLGTARTLDQYRAKYRLYRSDPGLRAMHAAHASYYLWDDHEVANNYWREGASDGAAFAARRAAGYRAWFEHQPVPRIGSSTRIYRSVRAGGLADLFFIDDRQYRDKQPCGDSILLPCPEAAAPGRAMLGAEQKRWLQSGLRRSDAPWKLVINGLMLMGLDQPLPGAPKFVDTWSGYEAERAELVGSWIRDDVRDVVVVTGDDHDNYAGIVTNTGRAGGQPGAVEFVVPSMTSANTAELLGGVDAAGIVSEADTALANPHLEYIDQRRHGYCVMTVRRDELRMRFRHVSTIRAPRASVTNGPEFRVRRGRAAVERV